MPDPTRTHSTRLRLAANGSEGAESAPRPDLFGRRVEIRPHLRRRGSDRPDGAARLRGAVAAIDSQSRRIEDLVRELGVLGKFGEEFDGPRAA